MSFSRRNNSLYNELDLWAHYDACCESGKIKQEKRRESGKNCVECLKCGNKNAIEYWISIDEYLPDGRFWDTKYQTVGFYCKNCNTKWGKWW